MKKSILFVILVVLIFSSGCAKNISGGSDATPTGPAKTVYFTSPPASASPAPETIQPTQEPQNLTITGVVHGISKDGKSITKIIATDESGYETIYMKSSPTIDFEPVYGQFVTIEILPNFHLQFPEIFSAIAVKISLKAPPYPAQYMGIPYNGELFKPKPEGGFDSVARTYLIGSVDEYNTFVKEQKRFFDYDRPDTEYKLAKYGDEYFINNFLVIAFIVEGNGVPSPVITGITGDTIDMIHGIHGIYPTITSSSAVFAELSRDKYEYKNYAINLYPMPTYPYRDPP